MSTGPEKEKEGDTIHRLEIVVDTYEGVYEDSEELSELLYEPSRQPNLYVDDLDPLEEAGPPS